MFCAANILFCFKSARFWNYFYLWPGTKGLHKELIRLPALIPTLLFQSVGFLFWVGLTAAIKEITATVGYAIAETRNKVRRVALRLLEA